MVRPRGIFCPACLARNQRPYAHARPMPGVRVRYFRCPKCSAKFKTREGITPPKAPAGW